MVPAPVKCIRFDILINCIYAMVLTTISETECIKPCTTLSNTWLKFIIRFSFVQACDEFHTILGYITLISELLRTCLVCDRLCPNWVPKVRLFSGQQTNNRRLRVWQITCGYICNDKWVSKVSECQILKLGWTNLYSWIYSHQTGSPYICLFLYLDFLLDCILSLQING